MTYIVCFVLGAVFGAVFYHWWTRPDLEDMRLTLREYESRNG